MNRGQRLIVLMEAQVLLLAAQQAVIDLTTDDKAFISKALNSHALK